MSKQTLQGGTNVVPIARRLFTLLRIQPSFLRSSTRIGEAHEADQVLTTLKNRKRHRFAITPALSLSISVLSLSISVAGFYFQNVRNRDKIIMVSNPDFFLEKANPINYQNIFSMPIALINKGNRSEIVLAIDLVVKGRGHQLGSPEFNNIVLLPGEIKTLKLEYQIDDLVHSLESINDLNGTIGYGVTLILPDGTISEMFFKIGDVVGMELDGIRSGVAGKIPTLSVIGAELRQSIPIIDDAGPLF